MPDMTRDARIEKWKDREPRADVPARKVCPGKPFIRVVRKLQFQNNFLLKTHFCKALARFGPNKSINIDRIPVCFYEFTE